ncbi:hypothetical protein [Streptantibioticus parmotrematis]|uniref:hypothetical protein n=1 Tax=Streptantibioticus parmotrematis TaxID=2873249 RepID=UPI00207BF7DC|nr:hypothetical protein [Streptantibioticus parmotrematis]
MTHHTSDPTGQRRSRPRRRPPDRRGRDATARRALRREIPSTLGLLADPDRFAAMRAYTTFAFDDHGDYLRQTQHVLRSLAAGGTHVAVALFEPREYADYCAATEQDPDAPASRTRYVAEVAAGRATVAYRGQPVERLAAELATAADRHATWERATEALAAHGDPGPAFDRASLALTHLLESVGAGTHHMVCSVPLDGVPLVAVLHADCDDDGTVHLAEADAMVLCTLLAAGLTTGSPGGLVLRTGRGTPDAPDRVRGWTLRDGWLRPLTEAQVFNAYCTDAETGEPVPPEPGVSYHAGTFIPPPEE